MSIEGTEETKGSHEHDLFRKWLSSLSKQELLHAMQIEFETSSDGCHEYDLLKEMIALQVPLETPVHPKALGYKPYTQLGPTLDYEHGKERSIWKKPRMFQWIPIPQNNSIKRKGRPQQRFDVIARSKVSPSGESWSLGTTREQREQDKSLLQGTYFDYSTPTPRLIFKADRLSAQADIIRTLHVSSRGHLFRPQNRSSIPFCSSWLQPTIRWFSLSLYLASRFQVALWVKFRKNGKANHEKAQFESAILETAITRAMHSGIKEALQNDIAKSLDFLRDSISWCSMNTSGLAFRGGDWNSVHSALVHIPLLEIAKPKQKLYALVRTSFELELSVELEKALLDEPLERHAHSARKSKRLKPNNKKRKGRRKKTDQKKTPVQIIDSEHVDMVSIDEPVSKILSFPDNQTSPRLRSRNIIMILSLLDDFVEEAFLKVGLEPSVPFDLCGGGQKNESTKSKQPYFRSRGDYSKGGRSEEPSPSPAATPPSEMISFESKLATERMQSPLSFQWPSTNEYYPFQDNSSAAIQPTFSQTLLSSGLYQSDALEVFSFGQTGQSNPINGWPFVNPYQGRERSILTDFFLSQEDRSDDELSVPASTAASISSSTCKDFTAVADPEAEESGAASEMVILTDDTSIQRTLDANDFDSKNHHDATKKERKADTDPEPEVVLHKSITSANVREVEKADRDDETSASSNCRSPSPQAPITPPPTLSPILVSLADLQHLKHLALTPERISSATARKKTSRTFSDTPMPGSLPSSPVLSEMDGLKQSRSREDLRIANFRDDHRIRLKKGIQQRHHRLADLQQSYKAVAVKSLAKPIASSKSRNFDFRTHLIESTGKKELQRESCAHSETAMDGRSEDLQWQHDSRKHLLDEIESKVVMKDETTTITSALSQREVEDLRSIREERNAFRDMCLTLGAEVAKLKAMLATQTATPAVPYHESFSQPMYNPGSFDPHSMPPFFHGMKRGQRNGAMSDAGIHRVGDHESQVSEDDGFDAISRSRVDATKQISSTATVAESETSIEITASVVQGGLAGRIPEFEASPVHGLQSRLTKDIMRFLNVTQTQLQKQGNKRRVAVERFSRLVDTLWPRAQVKLYGSHVSGVCLPSSDLDFVVCLPAVHKNAPALAPGVLEGRNAINESCQKLLARELKGESWIDPRSIKLIERTVVPVIKVSTKDTRARVLQLDISFDSPEHHGLAAVEMVSQILEELPLIRPLVLVLKQFLLDRGLLTAYTGGLSSYCLFLMVARYLQEQPSSYGDCGSLLMGFLDFYGNFFDPRATGISVRRRQYFVRPNYSAVSYFEVGDGMWPPPSPTHQTHAASGSPAKAPRDFLRRNSFSDAGSVDDIRRPARPLRLGTGHRYVSHNIAHTEKLNKHYEHGRPFTFDPLFVEDPLSSRNNVGRNAFRIFQVQRAFSDAHRALVASLEWDINLSEELNDDVDYPLLKCLLHSEDVLYEL
ncbi:unnamed protein product [Cylindrotheca closterium]|uniref:Polymerase nucleotidyl transferase domain-containing protein n=1 Tax=Cylindrotheca closterium TaxID=2856 RepID=A0AAD2CG94_9STRA|nr:unnamed protein product [Cylindrotheca closterium]